MTGPSLSPKRAEVLLALAHEQARSLRPSPVRFGTSAKALSLASGASFGLVHTPPSQMTSQTRRTNACRSSMSAFANEAWARNGRSKAFNIPRKLGLFS